MPLFRCLRSFAGRAPGALLLSAALACTLGAATELSAQTSAHHLTQAREGYRAGLALEAAGNWSAALAKFQEVAAVKITPQVRFHIALCQDRLGKWTEALGGYRIAVSEARAARANQVVQEAERALQKLESRIPKFVIRLKQGSEAASVKLDGVPIGATSLGNPILVDPGGHLIEVALPGRAPRQLTVVAEEGRVEQVEVDATEETAAAPAATEAATPTAAPLREKPAGEAPRTSPRVLPWVVLGTGGAALVASGVFYGLRASALSRLDDNCYDAARCPTSEKSTYDKGRTYTMAGNIALGVGAVGVGLGTVLLLTGGTKQSSAARASPPAQGRLIVHPSGVSLQGTF
jgi:tetratricopeptide (TPR) repeat protein